MITLHALDQSRAFRIVWLLEILEIPYTLQRYPRDPDTLRAPEALRAIHPLGKAPVLEDGDLTLTESGAIVDYLITRYGNGSLMPARDTPDYWHYQRWLHYPEASLMPLLLVSLIFRRVRDAPMPFFVRPFASGIASKVEHNFTHPQLTLHLTHINNTLNNQNWLIGDNLSGADIMMSYPLIAAESRTDLAPYANIRRYLQQIQTHPAWQQALEKAGSPVL
ncbi:MAG: glutathione S-transferase [Cardiobacteriaceae bacterium]|nr:glutathione S-transferase [Cardiobacteriaceae bacterium]